MIHHEQPTTQSITKKARRKEALEDPCKCIKSLQTLS